MSGTLSIGYYFHLPPGLKGSVVDDVVARAIEPLLKLIEVHPQVRPATAFSGPFLEGVLHSDKKLILNRIAGMAKEGLIELVATPHYSPALVRSSLEDIREHLILNVDFWRKRGCEGISTAWFTRGEWLTGLDQVLLSIGINSIIFEDVRSSVSELVTAGPYRSPSGLNIVLYFKAFHEALTPKTPHEALAAIKKLLENKNSLDQGTNLFYGISTEMLMQHIDSGGTPFAVWWERFLAYVGGSSEINRTSLNQLMQFPTSGEIQLTAARGEEEVPTALPVEQWPGALRPEAMRLSLRLHDMAQQIERLLDRRAEMAKKLFDERFGRAKLYLLGAQVSDAYWERPGGGFSLPQCRAAAYESIIRSQVEADSVRHPDVDPNYGWVEAEVIEGEGGEEDICVDTQLMRLYFSAHEGGALTEWDYKPRKVNFCNTYVAHETGEMMLYRKREADVSTGLAQYPERHGGVTLREYLVEQNSWNSGNKQEVWQALSSKFKITRQTKGLLGLRYESEFGSAGVKLVKEFTFKSGIGAHLSNATTGFQIEYNFDTGAGELGSKFLVIEWSIMMPSSEGAAASGSPLMCVGGVSDKRYPASEAHRLQGSDIPGGIYGIRMIDGFNDLLVDFRTSKPMHSVDLNPLLSRHHVPGGEASVYQGTTMYFVIPVERLVGGYTPFTLFISIM